MKTKDKRSHSSAGLKIHQFSGFHLDKFSEQKLSLSAEFSSEDMERVETIFNTILKWLKEDSLGGILIFAKKR